MAIFFEIEFYKFSLGKKKRLSKMPHRKLIDEDYLKLLANHQKAEMRVGAAKDDRTPPNVIRELCQDISVGVRTACAARENLEVDLFYLLAKDKSFGVLHQLAMNKCLPLDLLEPIYFSDLSWKRIPHTHDLMDHIRYHTLRNGMTQRMFDDALLHCPHNSSIYTQLVFRDFWQEKHFHYVLDNNPIWSIISRMARGMYRYETPTSVLERLYDEFKEIASPYLACNKEAPKPILKQLTKHPTDRVSSNARETLKRLKGLINFA